MSMSMYRFLTALLLLSSAAAEPQDLNHLRKLASIHTPGVLGDGDALAVMLRQNTGNEPAPPVHKPQTFGLSEGATITVDAPGFLKEDKPARNGLKLFSPSQTPNRMRGTLTTNNDGSFEYTAPYCWTGTESFAYDVCYVQFPSICSFGTLSLNVLANTPRAIIARTEGYPVNAGESLLYPADRGLLQNDIYTREAEVVIKSYTKMEGFQGDLLVAPTGAFNYTPPVGALGSFTFSYELCYVNVPCIPCSSTEVTFTVQGDGNSNLPNPGVTIEPTLAPTPAPVTVPVTPAPVPVPVTPAPVAATAAPVPPPTEAIRNDPTTPAPTTPPPKPAPGNTGSTTIVIIPNQDYPSRPQLEDDSFTVSQFQQLVGNILLNDASDPRYTLEVVDASGLNVDREGNFIGMFGLRMGSYKYTYTACYKEYPEVCSKATLTAMVTPQIPLFYQSRSQGRATAYLVRWAGRDAQACSGLRPNVTLTCGMDGELSLLDVQNTDPELCDRPLLENGRPDLSVLHCSPRSAGEVYVECRDMQDDNETRRQLNVEMHSDEVACSELDSTFHAVWLSTYCNTTMDPASSIWMNRGMDCSGGTTPDGMGDTLCFEYALGLIAQPADVVMSSMEYASCSYGTLNTRRLQEQTEQQIASQQQPEHRRRLLEEVLARDPAVSRTSLLSLVVASLTAMVFLL